jgi:hypothetical protein
VAGAIGPALLALLAFSSKFRDALAKVLQRPQKKV